MKQLTMKLSKQEKRGQKYLENPPKVRDYKRPITAFVHYESQGGELLAFAMDCANITTVRGPIRSDVVKWFVNGWLAKKARLIVLPSQAGQ